jgi:hypothetical protein
MQNSIRRYQGQCIVAAVGLFPAFSDSKKESAIRENTCKETPKDYCLADKKLGKTTYTGDIYDNSRDNTYEEFRPP